MSDEEMFDILDENGNKAGRTGTKRDVHENGFWHTGVHLCVTDGCGNVFQQLRGSAPDVLILPDVWDLFIAAGHVSAGEDPLETVLREFEEEVGVKMTLDELLSYGLVKVSITRSDYWVEDSSFPAGGYHHRVFDHNFVVRLPDLDPDTLVLEPKKVLKVRKYPISKLRHDLTRLRSNPEYLQHAHRPIEDNRLYQSVLDRAMALRF